MLRLFSASTEQEGSSAHSLLLEAAYFWSPAYEFDPEVAAEFLSISPLGYLSEVCQLSPIWRRPSEA
jgi:hypothetical protein